MQSGDKRSHNYIDMVKFISAFYISIQSGFFHYTVKPALKGTSI
jgi:hypothetical protein